MNGNLEKMHELKNDAEKETIAYKESGNYEKLILIFKKSLELYIEIVNNSKADYIEIVNNLTEEYINYEELKKRNIKDIVDFIEDELTLWSRRVNGRPTILRRI